MQSQREIPSIGEIISHCSIDDIRDFAPHLSIAELLIIGAKPMHEEQRANSELGVFNEIVKEKISELGEKKGKILNNITQGLYPNISIKERHVKNYLEKYKFLTDREILPSELENTLAESLRWHIQKYRNLVNNSNGKTTSSKRNVIKALKQRPVDLTYKYHPSYSESEPYLIIDKRKVPERIASKITYLMIKGYREDYPMDAQNHFNKRHLYPDDGIIKDIRGIQFVAHNLEELTKIKEYIYTSRDIEVLVNRDGSPLDDYYAMDIKYNAIHIDVVWNPSDEKTGSSLFNPHIDSVEIVLMEIPYFVDANFGPRNYLNRMRKQEKGIVPPHLIRGRLKEIPFTSEELAWKKEIESRIIRILNYNNSYE